MITVDQRPPHKHQQSTNSQLSDAQSHASLKSWCRKIVIFQETYQKPCVCFIAVGQSLSHIAQRALRMRPTVCIQENNRFYSNNHPISGEGFPPPGDWYSSYLYKCRADLPAIAVRYCHFKFLSGAVIGQAPLKLVWACAICELVFTRELPF